MTSPRQKKKKLLALKHKEEKLALEAEKLAEEKARVEQASRLEA